MSNPLITGIGPITAIGKNVSEFWESLIQSKPGIFSVDEIAAERNLRTEDLNAGVNCKLYSGVHNFKVENYLSADALEKIRPLRLHRADHLILAAVAQSLADADTGCAQKLLPLLTGRDNGALRIAVIVAKASMTTSGPDIIPQSEYDANSIFAHTPGGVTHLITGLWDLQAQEYFLTGGCPTGIAAVGLARKLFLLDEVDVAIVAGGDVCDPVIFELTSKARMIPVKSEFNDTPGISSKPFDAKRVATVLGESAVAMVLESPKLVQSRKARVYSEVTAYINQSVGSRTYNNYKRQLDPSAPARVMKQAVEEIERGKNITTTGRLAICANGSGGRIYDNLEAQGIVNCFESNTKDIPVWSIKGVIGQHGAGCALQAVASAVLSSYHGILPPTLNHESTRPDEPCAKLDIVKQRPREAGSLEHVLVNGISLGGFVWYCLGVSKWRQQTSLSSKL